MKNMRTKKIEGTRFVKYVRVAGTGVLFEVQVGPRVHTTLPLMGWVEGLPGLVNPWVAIERGGEGG